MTEYTDRVIDAMARAMLDDRETWTPVIFERNRRHARAALLAFLEAAKAPSEWMVDAWRKTPDDLRVEWRAMLAALAKEIDTP